MNSETMDAVCQELMDIANEYAGHTDELFATIEKSIVHTEYGCGGTNLHRGYYCPSLIDDIVIGNASRGKIYKRMTSRSRPEHEYCFDAEGKLRMVHLLECDKEYIIYQENKQIGLISDIHTCEISGIDRISLCKYGEAGNIISFALGRFGSRRNYLQRCDLELYSYDNGRFHSAIWSTYSKIPMAEWLLSQDQYVFQYDDHGNLSEYTAAKLYPDGITTGTPTTYLVYPRP